MNTIVPFLFNTYKLPSSSQQEIAEPFPFITRPISSLSENSPNNSPCELINLSVLVPSIKAIKSPFLEHSINSQPPGIEVPRFFEDF